MSFSKLYINSSIKNYLKILGSTRLETQSNTSCNEKTYYSIDAYLIKAIKAIESNKSKVDIVLPPFPKGDYNLLALQCCDCPLGSGINHLLKDKIRIAFHNYIDEIYKQTNGNHPSYLGNKTNGVTNKYIK